MESGRNNVVSMRFEGIQINLSRGQVVKDADKTLNGLIVFIRRLSFQLRNKGGLLENGSVKDVTLSAREGGRKDVVKPLTIEGSWVRRRGVGRG